MGDTRHTPRWLGWIAWGIVVLVASLLSYGCRSHVRHQHYFSVGAGVQLLIFWGLVLCFLFWDWNKLHLMWIAPLSFLGTSLIFSYFWTIARLPTPIMVLVLGILSPLLLVTRLFLGVLLVGIEKPHGGANLCVRPGPGQTRRSAPTIFTRQPNLERILGVAQVVKHMRARPPNNCRSGRSGACYHKMNSCAEGCHGY